MDPDISPIFNQSDDGNTMGAAVDSTPIQDILDKNHEPHEPSEQEQMFYHHQAPQQYYHEPGPPMPQQPHWDPFSTIGVTSWVVMGIIFIIGFIVGKLR